MNIRFSKLLGPSIAAGIAGLVLTACYAEGGVECRNVEVRRPHDVEVCVQRCGDEGCRTHCHERERYAREHRCWVD